jgi:hypothetical protein
MLSAAAQRADGAVGLPEKLKGAVAQKAAARLLREGLVEEVLAGRDLPAWRRDQSDQPVALLITTLGKETISLNEKGAVAAAPAACKGGKPSAKTRSRRKPSEANRSGRKAHTNVAARRSGTKQAQVLAMLRRPKGATVAALKRTEPRRRHLRKPPGEGSGRAKIRLSGVGCGDFRSLTPG